MVLCGVRCHVGPPLVLKIPCLSCRAFSGFEGSRAVSGTVETV